MAGKYTLLARDELVQTIAPRRLVLRRLAISLLLLLGTAAISILLIHPPRPAPVLEQLPTPLSSGDSGAIAHCPSNLPPPATPPVPVNLWMPLTVSETVSISSWLSSEDRGLNLTHGDAAGLSDNFIYLIEAFPPPKAAALAYLDQSADAPVSAPGRYARVTLHLGAEDEPVVRDYLVGPLPVNEDTSIRPLTEIYHIPEIPYNARGYTVPFAELSPLLLRVMAPLAEATQELFDGVALGRPNDTLVAAAIGPYSFDGAWRRAWIPLRRNVPGQWLHPVGFFLYVDFSGTDPAQWRLLKIVYNHQIFDTIESFLEAFHNGTLRRLPKRPDQDPHNTPSSLSSSPSSAAPPRRPSPTSVPPSLEWSTRVRPQTPPRDLSELPGPRQISTSGVRFRLDRRTQYVSWMGWGLYMGFGRDMGMSLWDVRFMGTRLIYELAPQEAIAQYAGNDPMQTSTAWLDRFFGMGAAVRDLLPGYDCPADAAYLPATTHGHAGSLVRARAVCVFEHDTARPISRHTGYGPGEFGAVKGYVLVVRSISTFDYIFHLDGTIEVRLSASGYLQAGYWEPAQEGYGAAIRETTMGSLHDHVINYKVDLDVVGPRNTLLATRTAQEERTAPWFDDDWGSTFVQQKITREYITNEDDARLVYPPNFQGGYALVNTEETNAWGIPRGYAIHPGYSPVHNTVVGSKRLLRNANWAKYNLAVSLRKDAEPSSSSMWNLNLPGAPPVDFDQFFDGENITQVDLVAWVNVGMHHLTQAEDSPNTRTNLAASSFFITPLNYFDSDISLDALNAVLLSPPGKPGDRWGFEDYGVSPGHCVPAPVPPFEYPGVQAFGLDGKPAVPASAEEMRKEAELYHRIKIEL
ncbi:amine oxidase catalytic domain-containing protein [Obba rivulosa]|uniref:Amine oxidase n=1 Tax=Obba rivulosa TaxID=1052685 RepID=A0A8E2AMZ7_9APHY|nr:amine oxidase catalytic domain-containing protein [Obba rivulosa]